MAEHKTPGVELLRLTDVHAWYGESHILHGIDLTVNKGEVVTLLGRNGAGRTTTLRAILGLVGRRSGSIMVNGNEAVNLPPHRIAHLGLGYCPEERGIFTSLTCEENLLLPPPVASGGMRVDEIYAMFPNLKERRASPGGRLSGGEQQMLTIARPLMGNPELILLDEPSEGLAPIIVQAIGELIRRLRDMGVTILLAEQNMHFCLGIATHAAVIDKGHIVYRATIEALRDNDDIKKRYLAV